MDKETRVNLLKEILAIDSTNGNEAKVAVVLEKHLAQAGIISKQVVYSSGRNNLVAEIGEGGPVLSFSGHMDVVSAGSLDHWDTDPFTPVERDGRLYARGASDMKSGLMAFVIAMIELQEEKKITKGCLRLLATVGEELGLLGSRQLTEEGYASDVDAMIIGEPSGHNIAFAHKGVINYTITSYGKAAHSSMPNLGRNAIDNLIVFYNEIEKEFTHFTAVNETLGGFVHTNSIIGGGDQINSVPDKAFMSANIRTIPEVPNELVTKTLHEVTNRLNDDPDNGIELVLDISKDTSFVFSDKNSKIVRIAKEEADAMFHEDVPLLGIPGGTDAAQFIRGNPNMQIVIFGPGNESIHQPNESVVIDNYLEMIDLYKKIALRYFDET